MFRLSEAAAKEAASKMDKVWYYMKSDRLKYGPYSDGEMIALIRQGILEEQDYIWMTYLEAWLNVGNSIYSVYLPANQPK